MFEVVRIIIALCSVCLRRDSPFHEAASLGLLLLVSRGLFISGKRWMTFGKRNSVVGSRRV